jgi:murein DD-endopeptidase MepM/ murein hydrolase activator NlpD
MADNKGPSLQGSRMHFGFLGTAAGLPLLMFGAGLWLQTAPRPAFLASLYDSVTVVQGVDSGSDAAAKGASRTATVRAIPTPPAPMAKRQSETLLEFAPRFAGYDPATLAEIRETVASGDTLIGFLQQLDVARMEAFHAVGALARVWNPRELRAGLEVSVVTGIPVRGGERQFAGLYFRPSVERDLILTRSGPEDFKAEAVERPLKQDIAYGGNVINSSLFHAGSSAGVPVSVLVDMIRAFSYNVDFQRDLQKGDTFEVLFDRYRDETGATARYGDLRYAALTLGGKKREIFAFDNNGTRDFFDRNGESIRRALLRTPVDGARISSGYGFRRHPILGFNKLHRGVDFAAPTGTPVRASGDGVIEQIGPFSSYGNYLRIRHDGTYSTAYAHLSGFRRGLQRGSRVRQGDVVAYIGTTGRSTGPHLHYEVLKAGAQVNPASLNLATGRTLAGKDSVAFRQMVTKLDLQTASLRPAGRAPLVAENTTETSQGRGNARN